MIGFIVALVMASTPASARVWEDGSFRVHVDGVPTDIVGCLPGGLCEDGGDGPFVDLFAPVGRGF